MSLFGLKEKKELELYKSSMPQEVNDLVAVRKQLEQETQILRKLDEELHAKETELSKIKKQIITTEDDVLLQSFGLYTPHYQYMVSDEYKDAIKSIREKQKVLIKKDSAVTGTNTWTVNGNATKGRKMVSDIKKLLLRAFNAECDDAIEHVTFSNIEAAEKKIVASAEAVSKLGSIMSIAITREYRKLKTDELHLMHEYRVIKQQEKEDLKEARAKLREEAKLAKEIADARRKLEKEQTHYENALQRIAMQLETVSPEERTDLERRKADLQQHLAEIGVAIKDVDYREANQKAGYVYIISNIGAFGENVYKIGMTRRLEPTERIDELGDASVPFDFDIHAMIFSDNAPALESALHNAFADRKLNFINQRREFFNVTLDEIKEVIKENYDKTVEFIDVAPAAQYRETLLMKSNK